MFQPNPPSRLSAQIVFSSEFNEGAGAFLNPAEYRALLLLLRDDTRRGEPVAGLPGMRGLDFAGSIIYYLLSADGKNVYLLRIERVDWHDHPPAPPAPMEQQLLRGALTMVARSAIVVAVRGGLKWIWDFIVP